VAELSIDEVRGIIADFVDLGGTTLEISGGEPVLHPSLSNIIGFASDKGLETRLYTSGVGSKETCDPLTETFLKNLRNRGLDKVIFNVQGPSKEIHDGVTNTPGSYKAVRRSIKLSRDLGFWIGFHFVPMKPNAKELHGVLKLARAFGVNEVALLRFVPQGMGAVNKSELLLTKNELRDFLGDVARLRKEFDPNPKIRTGCPLDFLHFFDKEVELSSCKAALSTCAITPEGAVIPCPAFKHAPDYVAGNIRQESLKSIWEQSDCLEMLRSIDYREIEGCRTCDRLEVCKGRCLAQRVRQNGHPLKGPDPDCDWQQNQKRNSRVASRRSYSEDQDYQVAACPV
jgi:pyrroloquinoline quinone biosynthesis protein E